ncbi:PSP1 domain-containing protein [Anaeropeptidivorans aminofermentans]|jgi:cell fate regulator YaaT (PSP1 superfamily)|uniref:PSP1 domain-containing protein n=1 Tax=Anaeropeptidivorans aminofermentans TaxID=2934315 RepID=UPI0020244A75|nr:stage 0 sporulation family protein [Anaeropeptidivorans aminofermentans]MBE6010966.1 stage 0 sporulation protein [Lachnospiraceae bacterium]
MVEVVGIRFKRVGKIYYFDPDGLNIEKDTKVIVETSRGVEFGKVEIPNRLVPDEDIVPPLKKVMRIATGEDALKDKKNKEREKEAFGICAEKIKEHGLDMKLIDTELTFDCNKIIFYFTSEGRVDFRDLVKDLAAIFRMRIELRQIGVRDESKMLNGIGICGRPLCCATFLGDFQPVSIKMAKEQNLSLNPTKISGICGRLMCCLKYEEDTYEHLNRLLPNEGDIIDTPDGKGEVLAVSILRGIIKAAVRKKDQDVPLINFYHADEIKIISHKAKKDDKPIPPELEDMTD